MSRRKPVDEALQRLHAEIALNRPFESQGEAALLSITWTWQRLEQLGREFFPRFGITEAQFNVLMILHDYADRAFRQHELADILVVNRASIGSVLERLERDGLVARVQDPVDRRAMRVSLTPAGKRKLDEVRGPYYRLMAQLFRGHEERDLQQLILSCDRLRAGAAAVSLPARPEKE